MCSSSAKNVPFHLTRQSQSHCKMFTLSTAGEFRKWNYRSPTESTSSWQPQWTAAARRTRLCTVTLLQQVRSRTHRQRTLLSLLRIDLRRNLYPCHWIRAPDLDDGCNRLRSGSSCLSAAFDDAPWRRAGRRTTVVLDSCESRGFQHSAVVVAVVVVEETRNRNAERWKFSYRFRCWFYAGTRQRDVTGNNVDDVALDVIYRQWQWRSLKMAYSNNHNWVSPLELLITGEWSCCTIRHISIQ